MALDFNEAPRYDEILEEQFRRTNRGFERREQAERANDARRERNAAMQMQLFQAIADFAPKAKGLADQLTMQREKKQRLYYDKNLGTLTDAQKQLWIDKYELGKDILTEDYKAKWKISHKIKEDGQFTTALDLMDESEWKKGRHGFLESEKNKKINNFTSSFINKHPDISKNSTNEVAQLIGSHIDETIGSVDWLPEALQIDLQNEIRRQSDLIQGNHREGKNKERQAEYKQERMEDTYEFIQAKSGAEFNKGIIERLELIQAEQNFGTLGQAIEYMQEDILSLVESGQMTVAQARKFEAVTFMHRGKKGAPQEELTKTHAKTFSNTNWDMRLIAAQKARLDQEAEEKTLYQSDFNNQITQIEQERGYLMSGPELANYIKDNYDITQGGPISDQIKNRLTFEDNEDDLTVPLLQNLWNKGLLTERDVRKLNSAQLRETWTPRIGTVGPDGIKDDVLKDAIKQAEGFANSKAKSEGKPAGRNNSQWTNIVDNAKYMFPSIYADEMKSAPDERTAYVNAVARMKTLIEGDSWNELVVPESEPLKRNRILLYGEKQLEVDPNAFQKDIIYGSEDILEQAEALHEKGQAHLYYKQLAPKIKIDGIPIHPMALQEIQLNIKRKKEGLGELPKSEMLKAYEALPPTVRTTLAQKVTPAKLMQAKIDAFGSDNNITYNEVEFLLEGILDEEFKRDEYKMTEEVEEAPEVINAQQRQRQLARESRRNDAVALKTRQIVSDFMQSVPEFLPEVLYGEFDFLGQIGEDFETRRQEVDSQNRRKRN